MKFIVVTMSNSDANEDSEESHLPFIIVTAVAGNSNDLQLSFRCNFCHFATSSRTDIRHHIGSHAFKCIKCGYRTHLQHKLLDHNQQKHNKSLLHQYAALTAHQIDYYSLSKLYPEEFVNSNESDPHRSSSQNPAQGVRSSAASLSKSDNEPKSSDRDKSVIKQNRHTDVEVNNLHLDIAQPTPEVKIRNSISAIHKSPALDRAIYSTKYMMKVSKIDSEAAQSVPKATVIHTTQHKDSRRKPRFHSNLLSVSVENKPLQAVTASSLTTVETGKSHDRIIACRAIEVSRSSAVFSKANICVQPTVHDWPQPTPDEDMQSKRKYHFTIQLICCIHIFIPYL